jgi:hypothetical protein
MDEILPVDVSERHSSRVLQEHALKAIFLLKKNEKREVGEMFLMKTFMI